MHFCQLYSTYFDGIEKHSLVTWNYRNMSVYKKPGATFEYIQDNINCLPLKTGWQFRLTLASALHYFAEGQEFKIVAFLALKCSYRRPQKFESNTLTNVYKKTFLMVLTVDVAVAATTAHVTYVTSKWLF